MKKIHNDAHGIKTVRFFYNWKKIQEFSKKMLDNPKFCAIILKCIIIAFLLWGFFALFSGDYVKNLQKTYIFR